MRSRTKIFAIVVGCLDIGTLAVAQDTQTIRGIDIVRDAAPDGRGIIVGSETISAIYSNALRLKLTPTAMETYRYGSDVIEGVDLNHVFKSDFSVKTAPNERLFSITGRSRGEHYVVDAPKLPISKLAPLSPFEFASELRFLRNDNPLPNESLGFGVKPTLMISSGAMNHRYGLRVAGGILKMLSPNNLDQLRAGRTQNEAVLAELSSTLSEFYRFLTRFLKIHHQIDMIKFDNENVSRVESTVTIEPRLLASELPALSDYLERILKLDLHLEVETRLPSGQMLSVLKLDTKTRSMVLTCYTRDGKLIPFDRQARLNPKLSVDIATLENLEVSTVSTFSLKVLGLKIDSQDTVVTSKFQDGAVASLKTRLTALATPKIEGRLLGLLPEWAIDFTIPGTIQGHAHTFSQGMLKANNNEGSFVTMVVDTRTVNTNIEVQAGTEIIDNFMLRIGMRIAQSYLWPNPSVIQDGWKLVTDGIAALDNDLKRLAAQTQAMSRLAH